MQLGMQSTKKDDDGNKQDMVDDEPKKKLTLGVYEFAVAKRAAH